MIAVLGSGSWATEIVHLLTRQSSRRIFWWVRDPQKAADLREGHRRLTVSSDIRAVVEPCDDIVVVVPSAFLLDAAAPLQASDIEGKNIISAVKGFIPQERATVTRMLTDRYGIPADRLCVLSGPSHAEEVARGSLTYLTVATVDKKLSEHVRDLFDSDVITTVYSDDMQGVETAAALKNIYAIAAGISYSLGFGDNLMGVLVAAVLREMERFITAYTADGRQRDMSNYIYLSDLLATCYSQHSRNRTFGELMGRGYSPKEARLMQKMVAEGYYAIDSVAHICRQLEIDMPIAQALYRILYQGNSARREFHRLINNLITNEN